MTKNDLTDYVWQKLGPRKHLAGRKRVAELVQQSVRTWPVIGSTACSGRCC